MNAQRFWAVIAAMLATGALFLPAAAYGGGTYRSPPSTPGSSRSADNTRPTSYSLPAGAPLNRTYTWYAPPAGYQVITQGTPTAPREVELVGPDGTPRAFRLEGPVVTRTNYIFVRVGSR